MPTRTGDDRKEDYRCSEGCKDRTDVDYNGVVHCTHARSDEEHDRIPGWPTCDNHRDCPDMDSYRCLHSSLLSFQKIAWL